MAKKLNDSYLIFKRVKDDTKRFKEYNKYRYKCKCGHSISIPAFAEKELCSYCGKWVFKNKRDEFIFRTKEKLKNDRTR